MAALPSPTQVAGTNHAIYEAYYHQVDPTGSGVIQALDAARFLKKSRLSDVVLSKIWDLSDPAGRGYLDKSGLFTALKLVALAQAGKDINMSNIHSETPPPKVGEMPKVAPPSHPPPPQHAPAAAAAGDWSVKPGERDKYNQLFDKLQPAGGLMPGDKVKGVLMESKLPLETLGKIWDLADQDKDGMLDRHEFTVAMHLVYKALEKHAIPTSLPAELRARVPPARPPSRPPSRPASRPPSPQPARPPPPRPAPHHAPHHAPQTNAQLLEELLDFGPVTPTVAPAAPAPWVVSASEKAQSDALFVRADVDRDGFVSGHEIKDTFLQSGLPQPVLAHIWGLCDWDGTGKLSSEQFALAMWLVARRLRGVEPPAALAPDMIPPSCRRDGPLAAALAPATAPPLAPPLAAAPPPEEKKPEHVSLGPQPTPELEAVAREVDALARERHALEADVQAMERELRVKSAENTSLQSEHDTLVATLKQLENQKGEAQKRLNDLKAQVEKLRAQTAAQEAAAAETEAEVAARRAAAATLRERERSLQDDVRRHDAEAEALNSQLRRLVLGISQANIKIQHLEEQERCIEEARAGVEAALAVGGVASQAHLSLAPQYSAQHLERAARGATPHDQLDEAFEEPADFGGMNGSAGGAHGPGDPFKDAAFAGADPFAPAASDSAADGFKSDPFARGFPSGNGDPFSADAFATQDNKSDNKDEFGSDPFAVLHAPTRADSASPTPSLPPKKHKTPPPRPAPPRPLPPAAAAPAAAQPAFSANFANFNNKWGVGEAQREERPRAAGSLLDFAEDPFKDYRYEDPFGIADPFADAPDPADARRPTSASGFGTDDPFGSAANGSLPPPARRGGRVSAPTLSAFDPFEKVNNNINNNINNNNNSSADSWAAWPDDKWSADDAWTTDGRAADAGWASSDAWAGAADAPADRNRNRNRDRNLNDTWPAAPGKKEKSPKPVKYARSLVHTIGGIGRRKQEKKEGRRGGAEAAPSEEQQWAWAAQESRRLEAEAAERRRREDAELQLALAISRSEK